MEWNDKYLIGVEHIDKQHKGLFTAVNRVLLAMREKDPQRSRRVCMEAVKYLKSYTLRHFADEEAYQLEVQYDGYEEHKAQHDAFTQAVLEKEKELEDSGYSHDSLQSFAGIAAAWLVNHIMNSDQKLPRTK